ncbi:RHS repeat domain-containing protein [Pseudomonas soli]|uniref:YD repeat-containing protein n=1 Tax=Pseudomonas soli TaxID=1306993 RepID=A0AAJ5MJS3_9PSED|nr:hypothetical protein [Pseudomonas soli]UXZ45050.1 hypothetical protein K7K07_23805 [Pseudomonas soli]
MSSIHTQASNFLGFMKTGVDNRTGQFTLAVSLPLPPANQLSGPALSVTLAFSVLGSSINKGYGLGWTIGLSELDRNTLRLASGEQYAIDQDASTFAPDTPLTFTDQKLPTLRVTPQHNGDFRVDKKSGECEILREQEDSGRYLVEEMHSPEGHRLFIDWAPYGNDGHFILQRIRDEQRALLNVDQLEDETHLIVNPDTPQALKLRLALSNDRLSEIHVPGIQRPFAIEYDDLLLDNGARLLLPTTVHSPLGAHDIVKWATGADGHQLPANAPFSHLPRVESWTHSAGTPDTERMHHYRWVGTANFLGFGSAQAFSWEHGRDNLYQVESDYQYEVVETVSDAQGTPLDTITRTWNRFHLPLLESSRRGDCEISTHTRYGIDPGKTWEEQSSTCQLPHQVSTTYTDHRRPGAIRTETTLYQYDNYGNITQVDYPTGICEINCYYPAAGGEGCPADPLGMVRFVRKKTIRPAKADGSAPVLSSTYTYAPLPSRVVDAPAHIVVEREQLLDELDSRTLEETRHTYFHKPHICYGRIQRSVTTLNDKSTATEYHYGQANGELLLRTTVIGFENDDVNRSTHDSAQSLLTGQTTWERSESGALTRYEYDQIGRIVRTLNSADSPYQTQRLVRYHLGDALAVNLQGSSVLPPMMIELVEVTGQRQRLWLDGDGRTRRIELEDLDNEPGRFLEIMHCQFDALGRQIRRTTQDWLSKDSPGPLSLTTNIAFDDWGQTALTIDAHGIHAHTLHDPITRRCEQWQAAGGLCSPRTVTLKNLAGSPIEQQHYDCNNNLARTLKWVRDGLDRVVEERLSVPNMSTTVTRYRYDHYSRVIEKVLEDGTTLAWHFAPHSDGQHPELITTTAPAQEEQA